jgi:hypothetical protein
MKQSKMLVLLNRIELNIQFIKRVAASRRIRDEEDTNKSVRVLRKDPRLRMKVQFRPGPCGTMSKSRIDIYLLARAFGDSMEDRLSPVTRGIFHENPRSFIIGESRV